MPFAFPSESAFAFAGILILSWTAVTSCRVARGSPDVSRRLCASPPGAPNSYSGGLPLIVTSFGKAHWTCVGSVSGSELSITYE